MTQIVSATITPLKHDYYDTNDDRDLLIESTIRWFGQSFIVGKSTINDTIICSNISILLYRVGIPGLINVSIHPVNSTGYPLSTVLCSKTQNCSTIATASPYTWVSFDFSPRINLTKNTMYAIIVRCLNVTALKQYVWREDITAPTYSWGNYLQSLNSGVTWTKQTSIDCMFRVYGYKYPGKIIDLSVLSFCTTDIAGNFTKNTTNGQDLTVIAWKQDIYPTITNYTFTDTTALTNGYAFSGFTANEQWFFIAWAKNSTYNTENLDYEKDHDTLYGYIDVQWINNIQNASGTTQYKINNTGLYGYVNLTGNTTSIAWNNNHVFTTWSHVKKLLVNNSWEIFDNDTGNITSVVWGNNHVDTTWSHDKRFLPLLNIWYIWDNDTGDTTSITWENHHINTTWTHFKKLLGNNSWYIYDNDTGNATVTLPITWSNNHINTSWSHTSVLLGNNSWLVYDNDSGFGALLSKLIVTIATSQFSMIIVMIMFLFFFIIGMTLKDGKIAGIFLLFAGILFFNLIWILIAMFGGLWVLVSPGFFIFDFMVFYYGCIRYGLINRKGKGHK